MAEKNLEEKIQEAKDDEVLRQYQKVAGYLFEATSAKTTLYVCFGIVALQFITLVVIFFTGK